MEKFNTELKRIKNGNREVTASLYLENRNGFIHWMRKKFGCPEEVSREIYQVSFFVFYDSVMSGKLQYLTCDIKTYLFSIGRNKFMEWNRDNSRFSIEVKDELLRIDMEDSDDNDAREEQLGKVGIALEKLGDPCKKILEMVYYENRGMDAITQSLGYKNVDTTKNLKYKCMVRLKKILEAMLV